MATDAIGRELRCADQQPPLPDHTVEPVGLAGVAAVRRRHLRPSYRSTRLGRSDSSVTLPAAARSSVTLQVELGGWHALASRSTGTDATGSSATSAQLPPNILLSTEVLGEYCDGTA